MRDFNFIPYWYKEKKKNKYKRIFSILVAIVVIFDIAVLYGCIFHIKNYITILDEINMNSNTASAIKTNKLRKVNSRDEINKSINIFEDFIDGRVECLSVEIVDKAIYLQIPFKNNSNLTDTIEVLDNVKGINIISINPENTSRYSENILRIELSVR